MELVGENVCLKDILNEAAVRNAMGCDMAFGGSTNTVLHLTAIAKAAPGRAIPKASHKQFMEFAVNMPEQLPQVGQAVSSK